MNVQRLFGSQRALKSIEDFTEFEQRAAYFDGDHVIAAQKGANVLERGSQVHFMAEVMSIPDFPPAPKLNVFGTLDRKKATPAEVHGQDVFYKKGRCAVCHPAPYYTDNSMRNLKTERFFKPHMVNGRMAAGVRYTPRWPNASLCSSVIVSTAHATANPFLRPRLGESGYFGCGQRSGYVTIWRFV